MSPFPRSAEADPQRTAARTSRPSGDAPRPGSAAKPSWETETVPVRRDTVLGDLVFLLRFAFGRY